MNLIPSPSQARIRDLEARLRASEARNAELEALLAKPRADIATQTDAAYPAPEPPSSSEDEAVQESASVGARKRTSKGCTCPHAPVGAVPPFMCVIVPCVRIPYMCVAVCVWRLAAKPLKVGLMAEKMVVRIILQVRLWRGFCDLCACPTLRAQALPHVLLCAFVCAFVRAFVRAGVQGQDGCGCGG